MHASRSCCIWIVASTAFLGGCAIPPLSTVDKARIEAASAEWRRAAVAGDVTALAAVYTDDAVLLPPNAAQVTGRAGIAEFFKALPKIVGMELDHVDVQGRADLAYVQGRFRMTLQVPGIAAPVEDRGKYLEVWRRDDQGHWQIARDMFNSDLPPAK